MRFDPNYNPIPNDTPPDPRNEDRYAQALRFASYKLKQPAARILREDRDNVLKITGVYLALTLWLRTIVLLAIPNPILTALGQYTQQFRELSNVMSQMSDETFLTQHGVILGNAWAKLQADLGTPLGMTSTLLLIVILLVGVVLEYGYTAWSIRRVRGEDCQISILASCFEMAGTIILLTVLCMATVALWASVLFPVAFYFWYQLRMASYLLIDFPELGAMQAYTLSGALLRGYKRKLLSLDVSLLGWVLLGEIVGELPGFFVTDLLVLNVLSLILVTAVQLFILPYRSLTYAAFYEELRNCSPVYPQVERLAAEKRKRNEEM